jgi:hypothetical protein
MREGGWLICSSGFEIVRGHHSMRDPPLIKHLLLSRRDVLMVGDPILEALEAAVLQCEHQCMKAIMVMLVV